MTNAQREAIEKHGRKLLALFPDATEKDPVALCKKLRRLENQASAIFVGLCNGTHGGEDADRAANRIYNQVDDLLQFGMAGVPVFLNHDPRGYALKINDAWVRKHNPDIPRDWGGYGLLAPEIDKDGN